MIAICYICIATVEVVLQTFLGSMVLCGSTPHSAREPFSIMKEIPLSQPSFSNKHPKHAGKYVALVDDEDYERLSSLRWRVTITPKIMYASAHVKNENGIYRTVFMHRYILSVQDSKAHVDHIDHNGLNNQKSNLRICSHAQNMKNKTPYGESQYLGVLKITSRFTGKIKWTARIVTCDGSKHLGTYVSEIDAARAYDAAAKIYHKEFANLNFKDV